MQESVTTITPEQSKLAMRRAIIAQCFGNPFAFEMTAGGLITLYAERFGARDFMVGIVNGSRMAGFAAFLLVPALIARYNKRAVLLWSWVALNVAISPLMVLPQVAARTSNLAAVIFMAVVLVIYGCLINLHGPRGCLPFTISFLETASFFSHAPGLFVSGLYHVRLFRPGLGPERFLSRFQILLLVLWPGWFVKLYQMSEFPQQPAALWRARNHRGHSPDAQRRRRIPPVPLTSGTGLVAVDCVAQAWKCACAGPVSRRVR